MFQHAHIKKKSFFLLLYYSASSVAIRAVFKLNRNSIQSCSCNLFAAETIFAVEQVSQMLFA